MKKTKNTKTKERTNYSKMIEGLANNGLIISDDDNLILMINEVILNQPLHNTWNLVSAPAGYWIDIDGKSYSRVYPTYKEALLECIARLKLNTQWRNDEWIKIEKLSK